MSYTNSSSKNNLRKIVVKLLVKIFLGLKVQFSMPLKKLRKVLCINLHLKLKFQITKYYLNNISLNIIIRHLINL